MIWYPTLERRCSFSEVLHRSRYHGSGRGSKKYQPIKPHISDQQQDKYSYVEIPLSKSFEDKGLHATRFIYLDLIKTPRTALLLLAMTRRSREKTRSIQGSNWVFGLSPRGD